MQPTARPRRPRPSPATAAAPDARQRRQRLIVPVARSRQPTARSTVRWGRHVSAAAAAAALPCRGVCPAITPRLIAPLVVSARSGPSARGQRPARMGCCCCHRAGEGAGAVAGDRGRGRGRAGCGCVRSGSWTGVVALCADAADAADASRRSQRVRPSVGARRVALYSFKLVPPSPSPLAELEGHCHPGCCRLVPPPPLCLLSGSAAAGPGPRRPRRNSDHRAATPETIRPAGPQSGARQNMTEWGRKVRGSLAPISARFDALRRRRRRRTRGIPSRPGSARRACE